MSDHNKLIEQHNLDYIRKQKQRRTADSVSPSKKVKATPTPQTKKSDPRMTELMKGLISTHPTNFSPQTGSPCIKEQESFRSKQKSDKSTSGYQGILGKCCILQHPTQTSAKRPFELKPMKAEKNLKRGHSFTDSVSSIDNEAKLSLKANLSEKMQVDMTSPATMTHKLSNHSKQHKEYRSISISKKQTHAITHKQDKSFSTYQSDFVSAVEKKSMLTSKEAEAKYKFSFKKIIPTFGLTKKTSKQKPEPIEFYCCCNDDRRLRNTAIDFNYGCVRSAGWLRNKFRPNEVRDELRDAFEAKMMEKEVEPIVKTWIDNDVKRTFSGSKELSTEEFRIKLTRLLECIALIYPQIGYVQGMNFIAATLLYHCDEYCSFGIIKILFEQLELKDMFLPSNVE